MKKKYIIIPSVTIAVSLVLLFTYVFSIVPFCYDNPHIDESSAAFSNYVYNYYKINRGMKALSRSFDSFMYYEEKPSEKTKYISSEYFSVAKKMMEDKKNIGSGTIIVGADEGVYDYIMEYTSYMTYLYKSGEVDEAKAMCNDLIKNNENYQYVVFFLEYLCNFSTNEADIMWAKQITKDVIHSERYINDLKTKTDDPLTASNYQGIWISYIRCLYSTGDIDEAKKECESMNSFDKDGIMAFRLVNTLSAKENKTEEDTEFIKKIAQMTLDNCEMNDIVTEKMKGIINS